MNYLFPTRECACCGKVSIISDLENWTYKRQIKGFMNYYCSWSCYRKEQPSKSKSRLNKVYCVAINRMAYDDLECSMLNNRSLVKVVAGSKNEAKELALEKFEEEYRPSSDEWLEVAWCKEVKDNEKISN